MTNGFPRFRPVADQALLVEFGLEIDDDAYAQVLSLDAKLAECPCAGLREAVPAYVSLLVTFDALITDHGAVELALRDLLKSPLLPRQIGPLQEVAVCYDSDFAPDLSAVAGLTGLEPDAVINAHLAQTYHVVMHGFAPGYAYLSGVPSALHLPRKPAARRGVAAGSVIIAAAQCLVTTLTMPTGWWIIGASPTRILQDDPVRPCVLDVGDRVRFKRIDRAEFQAKSLPP